jgi:hypothetical protein
VADFSDAPKPQIQNVFLPATPWRTRQRVCSILDRQECNSPSCACSPVGGCIPLIFEERADDPRFRDSVDVLTALLDKGLIKFGNFTAAKDRRRYAYVLTRKGITEKARLTRAFLARKMAEYEALRAEIEAVQQEIAADDAQESRS